MGELRRKNVASRQVMVYATLLILAIWLVSVAQFGTPAWMAFILAPVSHDLRMATFDLHRRQRHHVAHSTCPGSSPRALCVDHGLSGQISALCFNMLKWGFLSLGSVKDMADDNTTSDPFKSPTKSVSHSPSFSWPSQWSNTLFGNH